MEVLWRYYRGSAFGPTCTTPLAAYVAQGHHDAIEDVKHSICTCHASNKHESVKGLEEEDKEGDKEGDKGVGEEDEKEEEDEEDGEDEGDDEGNEDEKDGKEEKPRREGKSVITRHRNEGVSEWTGICCDQVPSSLPLKLLHVSCNNQATKSPSSNEGAHHHHHKARHHAATRPLYTMRLTSDFNDDRSTGCTAGCGTSVSKTTENAAIIGPHNTANMFGS